MNFWEWCLIHRFELIITAVCIALITLVIIVIVCICKRKKKGLFVFRRYKKFEGPPGKKQQHPKLIVDETEDKYGFMGLTESRKHGRTKNLPIKNPQKGDKRDSYIRKEVRYDDKDNFIELLKTYKLSRKDKRRIIQYLENRKKKK